MSPVAVRSRSELPSPPFESQADVQTAQEARAELTYEEYLQLDGAPPPDACDCCSCNATRNHAACYESDDGCECFESEEIVSCDPRVMCEHCGTCWCSAPEDYDDDE